MHSTQLKDDEGREWVINHNGDWSGEAHVKRIDNDKVVEELRLPAVLFRDACRSAVAHEMISEIEQRFL